MSVRRLLISVGWEFSRSSVFSFAEVREDTPIICEEGDRGKDFAQKMPANCERADELIERSNEGSGGAQEIPSRLQLKPDAKLICANRSPKVSVRRAARGSVSSVGGGHLSFLLEFSAQSVAAIALVVQV